MEEDLPGVIAPDFQPQAVEYQVVESSNNAEERNWWTALVIATRLNEDMIMRMRSCLATVRQCGTDFTPGPQTHCHQPAVGFLAAVRITSSVKEKAMKDFYQLANRDRNTKYYSFWAGHIPPPPPTLPSFTAIQPTD